MPKSAFKIAFLTVEFVWGREGPQHLIIPRADRVLCGMTRYEIDHERTETSKERDPERAICPDCEYAWKKHPASPWKLWGG